jgi:hypothetical protein
VTFPILDADGDLVTGATGLDSEVSKDAGTFVDVNPGEATEIATASGMYYLDLTATEMNADTVAIIVKTNYTGAKTTPIVLYPSDTGDIKVQLEPITHTSAVIPTVSTLTGHTAQTGDAFARLGAPAGASVSADVAGVKADTAAILVDTGTTLDARLPTYLEGGRMNAFVGAIGAGAVTADAIAADAITAPKIADGAIDRATFAADTGLKTIRSGTAQTGSPGSITLDTGASAVDDFYKHAWIYLTGGTGAGQVRRIIGYTGSSKIAITNADWIITPDGTTTFAILGYGSVYTDWIGANAIDSSTFNAGAIEAAALATDAVAKIADQVWDEILSGHLGAGSTGLALNSAGAAGDPWSTALPGAYGAGTAGKIIGDNVNAPIATVDAVVDAIKAKTDNLPSDPADQSLIIAATDAIKADTAAILVDTGTTLDAAIAAVQADTDALQAQFNGMTEDDGGVRRFTANALEQAPGGAGGNPNLLLDTTIATAPSQVSFTLTNGPTDNDGLKNQAVVFYDASSGNAPSVRLCTDYVASSKTITIDGVPDFTVIAGDGIKFFVTAPGTTAPTEAQVADAVWDMEASMKVTNNRATNEIKSYRSDGTTVRGTRRDTEIDANTQGLIPQ